MATPTTDPNRPAMTPQSAAANLAQALADFLSVVDAPAHQWAALDQIKAQADLHWGASPRLVRLLATLMVESSRLSGFGYGEALGTMVLGDSLWLFNQLTEAYELQGRAGDLFRAIDDEVGWGRTRIGRLLTSESLGKAPMAQALEEIQQAIRTFVQHKRPDLVGRATINLSAFHQRRGEFEEAEEALQLGLTLIGDNEPLIMATMQQSLGLLMHIKGQSSAARLCFNKAEATFRAFGQEQSIAVLELNRANLEVNEGNFASALRRYEAIRGQLSAYYEIGRETSLSVCYASLGDTDRARRIALRLLRTHEGHMPPLTVGHLYLRLAAMESDIGNFEAALTACEKARTIFSDNGATEILRELVVRRALIKLKYGRLGGDEIAAVRESAPSPNSAYDFYIYYLAHHLIGQASLDLRDPDTALDAALKLWLVGRRTGNPPSQYVALMLFGKIREAADQPDKALAHYQRATNLTLHLQRDLTIDLRPSYLQSVQASLHAAIGMYLRLGDAPAAFAALEQIKSLVFWQYAANSAALSTGPDAPDDDPAHREYIDNRVRLARLYRGEASESFRGERQALEQAIADYAAQLRLKNHQTMDEITPPTLAQIGAALPESAVLVAYYVSAQALYAFVVMPGGTVSAHLLTEDIPALRKKITNLFRLIDFSLAMGADCAWDYYGNETQETLRGLHQTLIAPLWADLVGRTRLYIAPYGLLHGFPFHALNAFPAEAGENAPYLGEQLEVVALPTASLLVRPALRRPVGALALGYDGEDDAYQMQKEAHMVARQFEAVAKIGPEATPDALRVDPVQVLHIAAHAEYNPILPHLSPIHLAGGPAYPDDLLRYDLSYELVALSACETGLAQPSGGDELVGLGRIFLYQGARALLTSLWRAEDSASLRLMEAFYSGLRAGASKIAALREAQRSLLAADRRLHPAFWAVHQLIGDPAPLSSHV